MTTDDYIDRLDRELRAASGRRIRLKLARVPRVPAGATALALSVAVVLAVAVPLLATHSRSSVSGAPPAGGPAASVVVGCSHTTAGQLPSDWRSAVAGTVVTGPVAWVALVQDAQHDVISHTQLLEALAVVAPGHQVTVSVPSSERRQLSLDYTSVAPRSRFYLSQGASAVTFKPCSGPLGQTQFLGGFIVTRAQCAAIDVSDGRSGSSTRYQIPLGRSCGSSSGPPDKVLKGNGIGGARFGASRATVVRKLAALLGRKPTRMRRGGLAGCPGINREVDWPGLQAYFLNRRFVGYSYTSGSSHSTRPAPVLATTRGLLVGDTIAQGKRLYGPAFHLSYAQGGSFTVHTKVGRIAGFLSDILHPKSRVLSIEAGNVGCPAMTP